MLFRAGVLFALSLSLSRISCRLSIKERKKIEKKTWNLSPVKVQTTTERHHVLIRFAHNKLNKMRKKSRNTIIDSSLPDSQKGMQFQCTLSIVLEKHLWEICHWLVGLKLTMRIQCTSISMTCLLSATCAPKRNERKREEKKMSARMECVLRRTTSTCLLKNRSISIDVACEWNDFEYRKFVHSQSNTNGDVRRIRACSSTSAIQVECKIWLRCCLWSCCRRRRRRQWSLAKSIFHFECGKMWNYLLLLFQCKAHSLTWPWLIQKLISMSSDNHWRLPMTIEEKMSRFNSFFIFFSTRNPHEMQNQSSSHKTVQM